MEATLMENESNLATCKSEPFVIVVKLIAGRVIGGCLVTVGLFQLLSLDRQSDHFVDIINQVSLNKHESTTISTGI